MGILYHRIADKKKPPFGSLSNLPKLFLRFLEGDVLAEYLAVLLELDFALDLLAILGRHIDLAGLFVLDLDEMKL